MKLSERSGEVENNKNTQSLEELIGDVSTVGEELADLKFSTTNESNEVLNNELISPEDILFLRNLGVNVEIIDSIVTFTVTGKTHGIDDSLGRNYGEKGSYGNELKRKFYDKDYNPFQIQDFGVSSIELVFGEKNPYANGETVSRIFLNKAKDQYGRYEVNLLGDSGSKISSFYIYDTSLNPKELLFSSFENTINSIGGTLKERSNKIVERMFDDKEFLDYISYNRNLELFNGDKEMVQLVKKAIREKIESISEFLIDEEFAIGGGNGILYIDAEYIRPVQSGRAIGITSDGLIDL